MYRALLTAGMTGMHGIEDVVIFYRDSEENFLSWHIFERDSE
jgi:hypothetical protein